MLDFDYQRKYNKNNILTKANHRKAIPQPKATAQKTSISTTAQSFNTTPPSPINTHSLQAKQATKPHSKQGKQSHLSGYLKDFHHEPQSKKNKCCYCEKTYQAAA